MKHLLFIVIVFLSFSAKAQDDTLNFPEDYLGAYKGDLGITNAKGKQSIGMEFHLTATDSVGIYNYVLVYVIDGKPSPRNYTLKTIDKDKGVYILDENNGIIIDAKLIDNALYFMFEVQNSLLTTTLRFKEESMDFEITFTNTTSKTVSGGEGESKDYVVTSYPIGGIQKAQLLKQ
jgi:hypothetical protein